MGIFQPQRKIHVKQWTQNTLQSTIAFLRWVTTVNVYATKSQIIKKIKLVVVIISLNEILSSDISWSPSRSDLDAWPLHHRGDLRYPPELACNFNLVVLKSRSSCSLTFTAILDHLDSVIHFSNFHFFPFPGWRLERGHCASTLLDADSKRTWCPIRASTRQNFYSDLYSEKQELTHIYSELSFSTWICDKVRVRWG